MLTFCKVYFFHRDNDSDHTSTGDMININGCDLKFVKEPRYPYD